MASVVSIIANIGCTIFSQKPTSQQARSIQSETAKPEKIGLEDLADRLGHGCSFRPCATNGTHDDGFISQQLFCVDVDNVRDILMPSDAVALADREGLPVNFGYHTFSSTKEKPKYRLCFLLDRPITDRSQRDAIQQRFIDLFGQWADHKCSNPARIFYGGNQGLFYSDFKAVIPAEKVLPKENTAEAEKSIVGASKAFIQAVKEHDSGSIRKKFGYPETRYFDNRDAFFSWLYRGLDLSKLLGVMPGTSFHCVLHADRNPSASVFRSKNSGYWLYKCFSDSCPYGGMVLTVKMLFEVLGDFRSEYSCLCFIKECFNVEVRQTEWASQQQQNIDLMLRSLYLTGVDSFSRVCPVTDKNIRHCKGLYTQILTLARDTVFPDRMPDNDENIIFYMSLKWLATSAGKNKTRASQYLRMLVYHGLLEILPDDKVPKKFLKTALKGRQNEFRHVGFYRIPSFIRQTLQEIECQGLKWKAFGYRISGISYECFYRTEGQEVAGKLYPQTAVTTDRHGNLTNRHPDASSDNLTLELSGKIMEQIESRGYALEADVVSLYPVADRDRVRIQLKRSMYEILQLYGLNRHKCNRDERQKYGISSAGYPVIITR